MSRPGVEPGNYQDARGYNQERREIYRDLRDARLLLRAIEWHESITAQDIFDANWSGRISLYQASHGPVRVDYTTGQYFAVEFRRAAAKLCASVLWAYMRDHGSPADPQPNQGAWLRAHFRKEFGTRIGHKYFD